MKKVISLLLALILCLGILSGCQQDPAVTTTPTTEPATTPTTEPTTEPTEPAWSFEGKSLEILSGHDINDLPLDKFVEEATGLSIKWIPRDDSTIDATLSVKVTPALIFGYDAAYGHKMGRYGAFVNLYDYKEIMPNFFARYEVYGEEIKKAYETAPGELYTAPVFLNGNTECSGWLYREDIFEALNLKAPTSWQELMDACAALKEAYPESYPLTFRNLNGFLKLFYDFGQQFGVDYNNWDPSLDWSTGTYYNTWITDEARNMLKMMRSLIDLGYMDISTLSNTTADWVADMASSKSFITHDKSWQLANIELAGKEIDPDFSLSWWHNLPLVESDLPYQTRTFDDYKYGWSITTRCPDVETAVRYLDWMYSDEGSLILSWGKQGESFDVDADGNKYFLEGYDYTYQARYQESGYIDFVASLAANDKKTQTMILETAAQAKEGDFRPLPTLTFTAEEQQVIDTYKVDWHGWKDTNYQKFLLGDLDINDDAVWNEFVSTFADYHDAELLAVYNAAYDRLVNGE